MINVSDLPGSQLFVAAIPDAMPNVWMGITTAEEYISWFSGDSALVLRNVRMLIMQAQPGNKIQINIGSPYFTDSSFEKISLFPRSVEVLGAVISDASGTNSCTDNQHLYQMYDKAYAEFRAKRSGITLATPQDMPKGNITQFPHRK
jgi:hypothetical protein